jgi:hypothetical protein
MANRGLKRQMEERNLEYYQNMTDEDLDKIYEEFTKGYNTTLKNLAK